MDIHLLRRLARRFGQLQRQALACCSVASQTKCQILTELLASGPLSIRDLAQRLGSDPPWVSRVVEQLRAQGLVSRTEDPQDRRRVQVALTAFGTTQAQELQVALNHQAERIVGRIPVDRRENVWAALQELVEALEAEISEGQTAQEGESWVSLGSRPA